MARMIPATIHLAVRSGAERLMFNAIKGAVRTENWICLHSFGLASIHQSVSARSISYSSRRTAYSFPK